MPRQGKDNRGGTRNGTPGTSYPNRTDLPAKAAPGQTYGAASQQLAAQRTLPMGTPATPAPATPAQAGPAAGGVVPGPVGELSPPPGLLDPTTMPNQPVTSGIDMGPGGGSEMMDRSDPDLADLARYLPGLEVMSTLPSSSIATRNLVRRLRGSIPLGQLQSTPGNSGGM